MRVRIIADEDSVIIFQFLGINGTIHTVDSAGFLDLFDDIVADPTIGVLMLSERHYENFQIEILEYQRLNRLPIIISIPSIVDVYN